MIVTRRSLGALKQSWVPKPGRGLICAVITLQICQGQSQHENWTLNELENLLVTIELKDKDFHNSIDWSGPFLQV